jgi:hypothetical protein
MTIVLDETIRGCWFLSGDNMDFMAGMNREPDGRFHIQYRFRYYANTGDDNDDRKSWYSLRTPTTDEEEAIGFVEEILTMLIDSGFSPPGAQIGELVRRNLPLGEFCDLWMAMPFCQKREPTPEEAAEWEEKFKKLSAKSQSPG